ncbi:hypothetical protein AB6A40_004129 [Gnathostoma spinigerum]|uniref:SCP domain-containing protein n=1 Tax=Gnathostoma spinigerum TaxID=75299 RepID=A0ABD6EBK7_9BILA
MLNIKSLLAILFFVENITRCLLDEQPLYKFNHKRIDYSSIAHSLGDIQLKVWNACRSSGCNAGEGCRPEVYWANSYNITVVATCDVIIPGRHVSIPPFVKKPFYYSLGLNHRLS